MGITVVMKLDMLGRPKVLLWTRVWHTKGNGEKETDRVEEWEMNYWEGGGGVADGDSMYSQLLTSKILTKLLDIMELSMFIIYLCFCGLFWHRISLTLSVVIKSSFFRVLLKFQVRWCFHCSEGFALPFLWSSFVRFVYYMYLNSVPSPV